MSLQQYSNEQLLEMSFIEIAYELLVEKKQAVPFSELLDEIAAIKNLSEQEVRERVAQFYTDLNIDGRFMALGENRWGLRFWYPVDHIEEEVVPVVKPKKKKAKKVKDEDLDDFDEVEEEEDLEFDEFEEDDLLDDEFEEDEIEDESEDEDILEDDDDYDLEDEIEEDELELEDEEEEEL